MRLRALVLEDDAGRDPLVELLDASELAEVVGAVGSVDEARQMLDGAAQSNVDVILVDSARGLDLLRELAAEASAPISVMTSTSREHATEAFGLGAIDFLLKPFTAERVEQCLRRAWTRRLEGLRVEAAERIVARDGRALIFLEQEDVWAFEQRRGLTSVHTLKGVFEMEFSLAAIELLFGRSFVRVHCNWLVRTACIREMAPIGPGTKVFVGTRIGPDQRGVLVPVSRDRFPAVRKTLLEGTTGITRR